MIYADNAATTKIHAKSLQAYIEACGNFYANPSSPHAFGHICQVNLENTRFEMARFLKCHSEEIYFTSGGTESNNLIISGVCAREVEGLEILQTNIEHPSVMEPIKIQTKKGYQIVHIKTDQYGFIDSEDLEKRINNQTVLAVFSHVNSEIGTIQNIEMICNTIKKKNKKTHIHLDCVQSFGKIRIDLQKIKADSISFSAHKIHGPKGIGGLFIRKGSSIKPLFYGGSQERGLRPGTEDLPAAMAFAQAVKIRNDIMEGEYDRMIECKELLINHLKANLPNIIINSCSNASPYIINISIRDIKGEILVRYLESEKIYISTGSACSTKKHQKRSVIERLGRDHKDVEGSVRISIGMDNNRDETLIIAEKIIIYANAIRKVIKGGEVNV
jgi:cysteine desulfurase